MPIGKADGVTQAACMLAVGLVVVLFKQTQLARASRERLSSILHVHEKATLLNL